MAQILHRELDHLHDDHDAVDVAGIALGVDCAEQRHHVIRAHIFR